ncbi:MAG: MATE family efflux transporter [Christensenellaceae bacterium]|jgi:putative MATE family efflux protein
MTDDSVVVGREEEISRGTIWKEIGKLAWPCAVEQIFASLMTLISTLLVSSLGKEAVNAVSITTQPMFIPNIVLQAFNVGGTALIARFLGMQEEKNARRACAQTLLLSILMSVVASAGLYLGSGPIIRMLGATDDYYYLALDYMRYSSIAIIFQAISVSVAAMLRGAGKTSLSMYFNILASVVNVGVGYLLISVFGLGVQGAGIAFLVSHIAGSLFALYLLFFQKDLPIHIKPKDVLIFDKDLVKRISRIGTGTALEQLVLRIGLIAFTMLIVNLGTAEYAAHNIAGTIHNYVIAIGTAMSVALTSLVGQNLGANKPQLAERYVKEALRICWICIGVCMAILLLFPGPIASLFTKEADVKKNLVMCFRMLALVAPGQILQQSICGGLRGGGDTKWPLISTMLGVLGMRMVMGYVFINVFDMGLFGAWLANVLDQNLRGFIIYLRFRSGKWKYLRV